MKEKLLTLMGEIEDADRRQVHLGVEIGVVLLRRGRRCILTQGCSGLAKRVVLELPESVADSLGVPEEMLAGELRKRVPALLYVKERVTLSEAAKLAGVAYADFLAYLASVGLGIRCGREEFGEGCGCALEEKATR